MPETAPHTGIRAPVGVDTTQPSIARVYDFSLGGKDNYAADRAAFEKILEIAPRQGDVSLMNRRWLHRVVRFLAGPAGIDQFLDIGAGLPTVGNTHQIAHEEHREASVVYVDNDPVVAAHGQVLLEQNQYTHFVQADILEPGTLLENRTVTQYFELDRPIALLVCGLLHHLDDDADPARLMREYIERLPTGSYVAITNFWDPGEEDAELHDLARRLERAFVELGLGSGWYRTRSQQMEYFDGLELLSPGWNEPPGLTELEEWWPSGPSTRERFPEERLVLGGVGHKAMPDPPRLRAVGPDTA
ncbi:SAM-dependent methyltransferase [Nocardia carnea]|uniref:SAM-dependent methyltransferase n=1 Tax=Nocardia carnea TaxID=37328 RepID=UPI002458B449|nr:SAM-dependent methyltransferase [Nocardia carnea]